MLCSITDGDLPMTLTWHRDEVRLSAGAGFVVAVCGEIMTMPGLPRVPSAEAIMLNDEGLIEGLF